jgi:CubicO group peptidase (beta-lactamase class C family)
MTQEKSENLIRKTMDECADSLLYHPEFRAVSIGVFKDRLVYIGHYGELDKGKNNAPSDNTLYEIASLTKTFTGTLLAQAIVDGKVKLGDDIRNYIPGNYPNLSFEGKPITFLHLLTHTSGLPRLFPNIPQLFDNPDYDVLPHRINQLQMNYSEEDFFKELGKVNLDTIPGYKYSYSNAGANVLGYCLETIYQMSFNDLLSKYLLSPLQMKNTKIQLTKRDDNFLAQGYNGQGLAMPAYTVKNMNAEGGLKSTVGDMMKYVEFHLNSDNPVVRQSHSELLDGRYGVYENGMFWQIRKESKNPDKIFQNGGAYGTSSWLTLVPESNTGVFVITNVSSPDTHSYLQRTVDKIIAEFQVD